MQARMRLLRYIPQQACACSGTYAGRHALKQADTGSSSALICDLVLLIPIGLVKVLERLSHRSGYALVDIHALVGPEARDVMV